ncbi:hypothetical protein BLOT_006566 [Blomia tropicalis]|nr:hypothetical protein BLOT_006566 [Blomia tropicalis]
MAYRIVLKITSITTTITQWEVNGKFRTLTCNDCNSSSSSSRNSATSSQVALSSHSSQLSGVERPDENAVSIVSIMLLNANRSSVC